MITRRQLRLAGPWLLLLAVACASWVYIRKGNPLVRPREQWSIGIVEGQSPFDFDLSSRANPIFTASDVTGMSARFVADPFLVRGSGMWYLFFEVYNNATHQGDLAVATSRDTRAWAYQGVVLDEPFHLSYPYVFRWRDDYYLIPESYEAKAVRLYRATHFPDQWQFVHTLVDQAELVDNSIVHFNDKWWLFSCSTNSRTLQLFFADDLAGPWVRHPMSPIVRDDPHKARSSGRALVYDGLLYRYTMDVEPPSGTHRVFAYVITAISPTEYAEKLVRPDPVLAPQGVGWAGAGMHQIDPVQLGAGKWVASVDGFGRYPLNPWAH
jgi:hypothetical protein